MSGAGIGSDSDELEAGMGVGSRAPVTKRGKGSSGRSGSRRLRQSPERGIRFGGYADGTVVSASAGVGVSSDSDDGLSRAEEGRARDKRRSAHSSYRGRSAASLMHSPPIPEAEEDEEKPLEPDSPRSSFSFTGAGYPPSSPAVRGLAITSSTLQRAMRAQAQRTQRTRLATVDEHSEGRPSSDGAAAAPVKASGRAKSFWRRVRRARGDGRLGALQTAATPSSSFRYPDVNFEREMSILRRRRRPSDTSSGSSDVSVAPMTDADIERIGTYVEREYRARTFSDESPIVDENGKPLGAVSAAHLPVANVCSSKAIKAASDEALVKMYAGKVDILADGLIVGIDAAQSEIVVFFDASNIHILLAYARLNRERIEASETSELRSGCGPCRRRRRVDTGQTGALTLEEYLYQEYFKHDKTSPYGSILDALVARGKPGWSEESKFPESLVTSELMRHMRIVISGPLIAERTRIVGGRSVTEYLPFYLSNMMVGNLTITGGAIYNMKFQEAQIGRLQIKDAVLTDVNFNGAVIGIAGVFGKEDRTELTNCKFIGTTILSFVVFHYISHCGSQFYFEGNSFVIISGLGNVDAHDARVLKTEESVFDDTGSTCDGLGAKVTLPTGDGSASVQSCLNVDVTGLEAQLAAIITSSRKLERGAAGHLVPYGRAGDRVDSSHELVRGRGDAKEDAAGTGTMAGRVSVRTSRRFTAASDSDSGSEAESKDEYRMRIGIPAAVPATKAELEGVRLAEASHRRVVSSGDVGGSLESSDGDAKAHPGEWRKIGAVGVPAPMGSDDESDSESPANPVRRVRRISSKLSPDGATRRRLTEEEHAKYFGFGADDSPRRRYSSARRLSPALSSPGDHTLGGSGMIVRGHSSAGIMVGARRLGGAASRASTVSLFTFLPEDVRVFSHIEDENVSVISVRTTKLIELYIKLKNIRQRKERSDVGKRGCQYSQEDLEATDHPFRVFIEYLIRNKPEYGEYAAILQPKSMVNFTEIGMLRPYTGEKLDLTGGDFSYCNFAGVIFNGKFVTLKNTNLDGANLTRVTFEKISLTDMTVTDNTIKNPIPEDVKRKREIEGVWNNNQVAMRRPDFGRASLTNIQTKLILFDPETGEFSIIKLVSPALERADDVRRGQAAITTTAGIVTSGLTSIVLSFSIITSTLAGMGVSYTLDRLITEARHQEDLDGNYGWLSEKLRKVGEAELEFIKKLYRIVDDHIPGSRRRPPSMMTREELHHYVSDQVGRGNYHPRLPVVQSRADEVRGEKIVAGGVASVAVVSALLSGNATLVKSLFIGAFVYVVARAAGSGARYTSRQARGTFDTRNALGDFFRHIGITWGEVVSLKFAWAIVTLFIANKLVDERTARAALTAGAAVNVANAATRGGLLGRRLRQSPRENEQRIKNQVDILERNKVLVGCVYATVMTVLPTMGVIFPVWWWGSLSAIHVFPTLIFFGIIASAFTFFKINSINRALAPLFARVIDIYVTLSFCCSKQSRSQYTEQLVDNLMAEQKKILLDEMESLINYIQYRTENNLEIPSYALTRFSQYGRIFKDAGLRDDAAYAQRVRRVVNRIVVAGSRERYTEQRRQMVRAFTVNARQRDEVPSLPGAMADFAVSAARAAATATKMKGQEMAASVRDGVSTRASAAWSGVASRVHAGVRWLGSFIPGVGGAETAHPSSVGVAVADEEVAVTVGDSDTTASSFRPTSREEANQEANRRFVGAYQAYLEFKEKYDKDLLAIKHAPFIERIFQKRRQEMYLMGASINQEDLMLLEEQVRSEVLEHANRGDISEFCNIELRRAGEYLQNVQDLLDIWRENSTRKRREAARLIVQHQELGDVREFLNQERVRLGLVAAEAEDERSLTPSGIDVGAGVGVRLVGSVAPDLVSSAARTAVAVEAGAALPDEDGEELEAVPVAGEAEFATAPEAMDRKLDDVEEAPGSRGRRRSAREAAMRERGSFSDSDSDRAASEREDSDGSDSGADSDVGVFAQEAPRGATAVRRLRVRGSSPAAHMMDSGGASASGYGVRIGVRGAEASRVRKPLFRLAVESPVMERDVDELCVLGETVISRDTGKEFSLRGGGQFLRTFREKRGVRILERDRKEYINTRLRESYKLYMGSDEEFDVEAEEIGGVAVEELRRKFSEEFDEYQRNRERLFALPAGRGVVEDASRGVGASEGLRRDSSPLAFVERGACAADDADSMYTTYGSSGRDSPPPLEEVESDDEAAVPHPIPDFVGRGAGVSESKGEDMDDETLDGASERSSRASPDGSSSVSSSGSRASEKLEGETFELTKMFTRGEISQEAFEAAVQATLIGYGLRKRKQLRDIRARMAGGEVVDSSAIPQVEDVPMPLLMAQKELINTVLAIGRKRRAWIAELPPIPETELGSGDAVAVGEAEALRHAERLAASRSSSPVSDRSESPVIMAPGCAIM